MRTAAALLAALAACAPAADTCPPGTAPATFATLAFGRNAGGTLRVTEAEWEGFLAEEATPRFPDGLTVLDATGQWRDSGGRIGREATKLLWIALPGTGTAEAARRVAPLAEAYARRFGQESVMRSFAAGCTGF